MCSGTDSYILLIMLRAKGTAKYEVELIIGMLRRSYLKDL
jgi:hypothetical protein